MKAILYDITGKKKSEVNLPSVFDSYVREDIAGKVAESEKEWQPHTTYSEAGKRHSASGTISHKRHDWKGQYGRGISRTPRKALWRRGTQFNWVGAEVSNTRGGRRPHPHKLERYYRKINKKEQVIALNSAIAATGDLKYVSKRYSTLKDKKLEVPAVVESNVESVKFKNLKLMLKSIYGDAFNLILQHKTIRAGVGKMRGRTYKSNAGLLLVKSSKEKVKVSGIDLVNAKELRVSDLWPLGRIVLYTEKALEELGGKK